MSAIIRPAATRGRGRKQQKNSPNRPRPVSPIYITNVLGAGSVLTLTFDQPVSLSGVPKFATDLAGPVAVSAAKTGADTVAITMSASIVGSSFVKIPFRDPAIRNSSGGYVTSDSVPI